VFVQRDEAAAAAALYVPGAPNSVREMQMIGNIDFSLYSSPTTAYGNVAGEIDVDEFIRKENEIPLLVGGANEWFSGRLKVRSVHPSDEPDRLLIELEDVVAPWLGVPALKNIVHSSI
jgi:hypothetical protein